MCGIAGYAGDRRPEILEPMCLAMAHRGPDDMGTWHDPQARVGLGHRRLSIIDTSPAGHQPMGNADGSIWISFNGEIYNFEDFRSNLAAKGYHFRSRTDTEVLLYLYEEYGLDFLERLNGIFALAIWDGRSGRLVLARDHAGIKPLYYHRDGERLFFASEIKALLRIPGVPRRLNTAQLPAYLTLLWVPGPHTMLEDIEEVEPGQVMVWEDGRIETRRWFRLEYTPDEAVSRDEWVVRVHDTFTAAARRQMVSDVPLGAFLSGGADSSSIVAGMRRAHPERDITCYTIDFPPGSMARDGDTEDVPYARRVARHLDVELKTITLETGAFGLLPLLIYHLDEPDADPAIFPSYLISRLARDDGTTVLLSGTGGDEVLFGYRSHVAHRTYERLDRLPGAITGPPLRAAAAAAARLRGAQSPLARRLAKLQRGLGAQGLERHMALVDWSNPATRRTLLTAEAAVHLTDAPPQSLSDHDRRFLGSGELNRHTHLLINTFLADHNLLYTDKTSMAASVEARVPFLDVDLMRLCATIPERHKLAGRVTKSPLKRAMERYLPRDVLYRPKTGFMAPLRTWVAKDLAATIDEVLSPDQLRHRGLFDPAAVRTIITDNAANRADHAYLIYALLTLELWMATFLDRPGEQVGL